MANCPAMTTSAETTSRLQTSPPGAGYGPWKWAKIDITGKPRVVSWVKRVRARPGVERGISFGVPKDEIDQFSEERKARYRQGGASIASNWALKNKV